MELVLSCNFGCPVAKVCRRGGGAALPYKRRLFANIIAACVEAASPHGVPVTAKFRVGIDDAHHTYLDAGRIAAAEGAVAVALHARTAAQRYSGQADWTHIARLKEAVTSIPVLGNGDIFTAADAVAMMAKTGCDGVVVGRGCLGRPWLFGELQAAFAGAPIPPGPPLGEVAQVLRRHAELLVEHDGPEKGIRDLRKHMAWYFMGFPVGAELRRQLAMITTMSELDTLLSKLDPAAPSPSRPRARAAARARRGRSRCRMAGRTTRTIRASRSART